MADTRDQTLTQVQSPMSPGEQRDRAVLLVSGNAVTPGLAARTRLQIVGDELYLGRRAEGLPVQASVAVLDDGLVSSQHARIVRGSGGYDLEDLGSKNGTFIDNLRAEGRQRLRDGALVFVGNHIGVFRMVSSIELEAKYPRPELIPITNALVGKTFCTYCGGPFPAELVSCPHCGAPAPGLEKDLPRAA